jgi:hypothetical protein
LWFLATDSYGITHETETQPYTFKIYGKGKLSIEQAFEYYNSIDFWTIRKLASYISDELSDLANLFEGILTQWHIPNSLALEKLCEQFPRVAEEFGLIEVSADHEPIEAG